jgi:putative tryptophan/tyrosine transport system substrate-binding protein
MMPGHSRSERRFLRRRDFITLFGAAAATAWPPAARAQQPAPVVGFLDSGSAATNVQLVDALRQGLKEEGYVEGERLTIEYRWAEGDYDRLPALAADLVRRQVAVIVATGGEPSARAAQAATTTIPIVFDAGRSPVELGMVTSLNRPGGNMTGVNQMVEELVTKQLGFLHQIVPQAETIAMLENPNNPRTDSITGKARTAANELGRNLVVLTAGGEPDFDTAFAKLAEQRAGALLVGPDPFFYRQRERIVALAARHAVPALYVRREFAVAGGLISYGTSLADTYRQVGVYAGRILDGAKPADLPVVQPTKFELVINLKTAKTLGLAFPPSVLAIADEVIE